MAKSQSPSAVVVTYWNGRGKCEPLRMLLAAAGVRFQQKFINHPMDLEDLRKTGKLMYDQVPLVEMDGLCLIQTSATAQYIAKQGALYPSDAKDAYLADAVYQGVVDMRIVCRQFPFHLDKRRMIEELSGKKERYFDRWERMLAQTVHKSGYFLAKASMADVVVFEVLNYCVSALGREDFDDVFPADKYPGLRQLLVTVPKLGWLQEYLDTVQAKQLDWADYGRAVDRVLGR